MLQEIITYMIVGSAITLAVLNFLKIFRRKKAKKQKINFKKESFSIKHNCSDCSADCMLRDAGLTVLQKNKDICKKIEIEP